MFVTGSVFQPTMSNKRTILSLSLDQRIEVLRRVDETHRVERLLPSWCGKTQAARIVADRGAILGEWNSCYRVDIKYVMRQNMTTSICVLYNTSAVICCINFRLNNYCMHNQDTACTPYSV